jgi:hypothetical protein
VKRFLVGAIVLVVLGAAGAGAYVFLVKPAEVKVGPAAAIKPLALNGMSGYVFNQRATAIDVVLFDGDPPHTIQGFGSLAIPTVGGPKPPWHLRVTDHDSGSEIGKTDRHLGDESLLVDDAGVHDVPRDHGEKDEQEQGER